MQMDICHIEAFLCSDNKTKFIKMILLYRYFIICFFNNYESLQVVLINLHSSVFLIYNSCVRKIYKSIDIDNTPCCPSQIVKVLSS